MYKIKSIMHKNTRLPHLGCAEEDGLGDVWDSERNHTQGNAREDVGIVALARVECLALVGHWIKWTATGKHTPTLW